MIFLSRWIFASPGIDRHLNSIHCALPAFPINLLDCFDITYNMLLTAVLFIRSGRARTQLALERSLAGTLITTELPGRQLGHKHLVDFFKRATLDLWQKEVDPDCGDEARGCPNVAVPSRCDQSCSGRSFFRWIDLLWTPVQGVGVDEVWSGESCQPGAEEACRCREAEGV